MGDWPPITEPELRARMALEKAQFVAVMRKFWSAACPRELERSAFERALGYPWERPAASFILRDENVQLLAEINPDEARAAMVESFARDRHPLLAFGGNAAPNWLATKFAHFPDEVDRTVLVLAGSLHDFDASTTPTS